jgi:hypothetical protein
MALGGWWPPAPKKPVFHPESVGQKLAGHPIMGQPYPWLREGYLRNPPLWAASVALLLWLEGLASSLRPIGDGDEPEAVEAASPPGGIDVPSGWDWVREKESISSV